MQQLIKLRPHHLICLNLFRGKGYSDKFTINMTTVKSHIDSHDTIHITEGKDDICSHCPNSSDSGLCITESKVNKYDDAIRKILDLKSGKDYSFTELTKMINISSILDEVCSDCSWNSFCKQINGCTVHTIE